MAAFLHTVIYDGEDSGNIAEWIQALSKRHCNVVRPSVGADLHVLLSQSPRAVVVLSEYVVRHGEHVLEEIQRQAPTAPVLIASSTYDKLVENALARGVKDVLNVVTDPPWLLANRVAQYLPALPLATNANATEPPIPTVPLPALYSASGRLNAAAVADYIGVPLKELAEGALGAKYSTVYKTPDAESLQEKLREFARVLELLNKYVGDKSQTRTWLRRPHSDLSDVTPLQVMLLGRAASVRALLEDAINGYAS